MAKKEYTKTKSTGRRTVTKTKAADGSKSRTVTRAKKDGTSKVKSKTKSGGVVTKRKVTVGPKKVTTKTTLGFEPIGKKSKGAKRIVGETKTTTQSVKGKETVRNRKAKKGAVRKTKSKIDGTRTTKTRTAKVSGTDYGGPRGIYAPKAVNVDGTRQKVGFYPSKNGQSQTATTTTPAKRTTVKAKVKKKGRK